MSKENQVYYRIDNSYYELIKKPLISGDFIEKLVPRKEKFIVDDHQRNYLKEIEKYHGFCCIPSHTDFKQVINKFYNTYNKIEYKPKSGKIINSLKFVKHIFGDQVEFGLDYLKILYEKPTQMLPVLCLVSKLRNTGKTTFLNWLKKIYGNNMTYNKNDDFRSQFNSDWLGKLLIAVDEVLFDRKEDQEKIKNLSTAKTYKVEAKGKDRTETEFWGKIILCSNFELRIIKIDKGETRYWVRKILPFEVEDVDLLKKLTDEIPAFIEFLLSRKYHSSKVSRMWFNPLDLETDALNRIIRFNRDDLEVELVSIIYDIMETHNLDKFQFCPIDLKPLLNKTSFSNISRDRLKSIYKNIWQLKPAKNNLSYKKVRALSDGTFMTESAKGRYFSINRDFLRIHYGDLLNY